MVGFCVSPVAWSSQQQAGSAEGPCPAGGARAPGTPPSGQFQAVKKVTRTQHSHPGPAQSPGPSAVTRAQHTHPGPAQSPRARRSYPGPADTVCGLSHRWRNREHSGRHRKGLCPATALCFSGPTRCWRATRCSHQIPPPQGLGGPPTWTGVCWLPSESRGSRPAPPLPSGRGTETPRTRCPHLQNNDDDKSPRHHGRKPVTAQARAPHSTPGVTQTRPLSTGRASDLPKSHSPSTAASRPSSNVGSRVRSHSLGAARTWPRRCHPSTHLEEEHPPHQNEGLGQRLGRALPPPWSSQVCPANLP